MYPCITYSGPTLGKSSSTGWHVFCPSMPRHTSPENLACPRAPSCSTSCRPTILQATSLSSTRANITCQMLSTSSSCAGARERLRALRRSEEHTSELQSPLNLVCRILLEKKKKAKTQRKKQETGQTGPRAPPIKKRQ